MAVSHSVLQSTHEPEFTGLDQATTGTGWKSENLLKTGKKVLAINVFLFFWEKSKKRNKSLGAT